MIVLVEDDDNKARQIISFLSVEFKGLLVEHRKSYTSGLKAIRELKPILVLLDMSLPNYDGEISSTEGGKFRSYGGRDILYQLSRRGADVRVLVVTQYDSFSSEANAKSLETLAEELGNEFPQHFIGAVFYSASQDDWKNRISDHLEKVLPK